MGGRRGSGRHPSLDVEPTLRGSLAELANGRVLVIDYFASRRCSIMIGELTGDFENTPPGMGYVELASIEGCGSSRSHACEQAPVRRNLTKPQKGSPSTCGRGPSTS